MYRYRAQDEDWNGRAFFLSRAKIANVTVFEVEEVGWINTRTES